MLNVYINICYGRTFMLFILRYIMAIEKHTIPTITRRSKTPVASLAFRSLFSTASEQIINSNKITLGFIDGYR